jgi:Domain of unknown function (DUF1841)
MRYDPMVPPVVAEWSALGESDQIELVVAYHKCVGVKLPNLQLHSGMHVTIENQILLGDQTPVAAAFARLIREGLDRHDALHAIAGELTVAIFEALKNPMGGKLNEVYYDKVKNLTATSWRAS